MVKDIKKKIQTSCHDLPLQTSYLQLFSLAHHSPETWACFLFLKNIKPITTLEPLCCSFM